MDQPRCGGDGRPGTVYGTRGQADPNTKGGRRDRSNELQPTTREDRSSQVSAESWAKRSTSRETSTNVPQAPRPPTNLILAKAR